MSTFAGTGVLGYSGDGGQATSAVLNTPDGLALASDGSLFISDLQGCNIRFVSLSKIISTFAGTGACTSTGNGGPATSATFSFPRRVAFAPSGDLMVAEDGGSKVRGISAASGIVYAVAGGGSNLGDGGAATSASIGRANGLAFNSNGELLFSTFVLCARFPLPV